MATNNSTGALPNNKSSLNASEYLEFLRMIESTALPTGTRAYMVSIDEDGRRSLSPVTERCSVVDLSNADNLIDHLNNAPRTDETLQRLSAYCADRLSKSGKSNVDAAIVAQSCRIMEEIAHRADIVDRGAYFAGLDGDIEDLSIQLARMRHDVKLIGMFADKAVEKLGGIVGRSVDEWLLPPSYNNLSKSANASLA